MVKVGGGGGVVIKDSAKIGREVQQIMTTTKEKTPKTINAVFS